MDNENRAMTSSSSLSNSSTFSFISKGWREVRDLADADIQLMRHRANSFKNLVTLFEELKYFFNSATTLFFVPVIQSPPAEIDFVKMLQLKLSKFQRAYLSPNLSKKVLEKWTPRSRLWIDLSTIRNAIVVEVEDGDGVVDFDRVRKRNVVSFREFWGEWKSEVEGDKAAQRRKKSFFFSLCGFVWLLRNEFCEGKMKEKDGKIDF